MQDKAAQGEERDDRREGGGNHQSLFATVLYNKNDSGSTLYTSSTWFLDTHDIIGGEALQRECKIRRKTKRKRGTVRWWFCSYH